METLVKFIPAEAVALFLVLDNLIKSNAPENAEPESRLTMLGGAAIIFCAILNIVYLATAKRAAILKLDEPNSIGSQMTAEQRLTTIGKLRKDFHVTWIITTIAYLVWVYNLPAWVIADTPIYWDLLGAFVLALFTAFVPAVNGLMATKTA